METVRNLFARLQDESDRLPALLDGKAYLVNMNAATLKQLISVQEVALLFPCLDTNDAEQVSTVVFILKLLLPILDVGSKFEVLSQSLCVGLSHSNSEVRSLCLQQFKECCMTEVGNAALAESKNVIGKIVELVGDPDMSIALSAADVLSEFGSYSLEGAKVMLRGELLENIVNVMKKEDKIRYRIYDIVVRIQSNSPEHLAICNSSNLLKSLIAELMGDDVLVRVVCIASLAEMAMHSHSLEYLKSKGVLDRLILLIANASSDPISHLYMPEIVKFFGKMSYQDGPQNVISIFPQFIDMIFGLIDDSDSVKKKIGVETLGFIGQTVEGKHVLAKEGLKITKALQEVGSVIQAEGTDLRLIAVNAMSQLLHIDTTDQTEDLVNLSLKWFQCISCEPVDTILSLCRQPFTSVKCAGFHLIKTLSLFSWGLEALVEFPTFVEFILDRSADSNKESKDARYEAVKGIAESPRCIHIFGNHNYLKFQAYVKEGPLHQVVLSPEVAMETS